MVLSIEESEHVSNLTVDATYQILNGTDSHLKANFAVSELANTQINISWNFSMYTQI